MHVDQQTTFRSLAVSELTESELDQVNGGLILERLSVVLGIAITGGIAAGIMSCDTGTLNGPLVGR
jgi:lactobin A/cerein 7B family class IIb bacteriocin